MLQTKQFILDNMGIVRPDWLVPEIHSALGLDEAFRLQFRNARDYLRKNMDGWADLIVMRLMRSEHLPPDFSDEQMEYLRRLFAEHKAAVMESKFDEGYFRTIDALGLYFIYHNILPIHVVGGIKCQMDLVMDELAKSDVAAGRMNVARAMMTFLTLEVNQIQRVYIAYYSDGDAAVTELDEKFNARVDGTS